MLTATKGPGDPVTWPRDPADVIDLDGDDIRQVIAAAMTYDPVGRDIDELMDLMIEEAPLDERDTLQDAITYLAQHMDAEDFPPNVHDALFNAFNAIAQQTDVRFELYRRRRMKR